MRLLALLAALVLASGCDNGGSDGDADVDVDADGDSDSDSDSDVCPPEAECCSDAECSNGIFCDGMEVCDRGRCDPGFPVVCDDGLDCTEDICDEMANLCVYEPVHEQCDDADSCNGVERCDPADEEADERGCLAGMPRVCDDGDDCTEDYCEDDECLVRIRDADGDGFADRDCSLCDPDDPTDCVRGDDCDDNDDAVFPGAVEVCDDGKDNNCDRDRDYAEAGCSVPNDSCSTALELRDGVTVYSSTRGTSANIDESCGPPGNRDVAFYFAIPAERDVLFELDAIGGSDLYVALTGDCGAAVGTMRCEHGRDFTLWARALPAGTYYVVAAASSELDFSIRMTAHPVTTRPDGDLCSDAGAISGDGSTVSGTLVDASHDYTVTCADDETPTRDVVYTIRVPTEQTADFVLTRTSGSGPISLSVEDTCGLSTSERACWTGEPAAEGRLWRVLPGTYYLVVSHADEVTFDLSVTLSPLDPDLFFAEDFGGGTPGWTMSGRFEHGTPTAYTEPTPEGGACIGTVMGGDFADGMTFTTDYAQTPAIDLRGSTAPVLQFRSWLRSPTWGDYAGFHVELSIDGGPYTTATGVTPAYDGYSSGAQAWFGDHGRWETWEVSLAAYAGSVVTIRFAAYTTPYGWERGPGWYVDNVLVIDP